MKKSNKYSSIIVFLMLLIGVGYAILQANLQINGTAKITQNTWDVHFENIVVNPDSVSIGTGDTAAVIDPTNNCKVDFEVTLSLPGDFYEFTVDVKNEGTIDAMIGTLTKSLKVNNVVVEEMPYYLNYTVTYEDDSEIQENHLLAKNTTETYKVRLEYRSDIDELPTGAQTISTSLEPVFLQADSRAVERPFNQFLSGQEFNEKIKRLAGNSEATYSSADSNITAFRRSLTAPDISLMTQDNIVSVSIENPIYAWFDNGIIYYYSDEEIFLNTDSSRMFSALQKISVIELDTINTSRTTNMSSMFASSGFNASSLTMDLSNWDTSKVTNMSSMFNCAGMMSGTFVIGDLSNWDTSKVTSMSDMFSYAGHSASTWSIGDLSNWDTSNVTSMSWMFAYESVSTTWSIGDLSNWNTSNVTDMNSMFYYAGCKATIWSVGDLSNWDTSKVTNMNDMFCYAGYFSTSFTIGNISNWDISNVNILSEMFAYSGYNATTWSIGDLSSWNTSKVTNMYNMFASAGYSATTFSIGDLSNWDTSKVTSMSGMFSSAGASATTWNSIGTLKVYATDISYMFSYCKNAKATLKIYNNPTNYSYAFNNATTVSGSGITVDYTSAVTNIDNIIATKSSSSNVVKGSLFTP